MIDASTLIRDFIPDIQGHIEWNSPFIKLSTSIKTSWTVPPTPNIMPFLTKTSLYPRKNSHRMTAFMVEATLISGKWQNSTSAKCTFFKDGKVVLIFSFKKLQSSCVYFRPRNCNYKVWQWVYVQYSMAAHRKMKAIELVIHYRWNRALTNLTILVKKKLYIKKGIQVVFVK